MVCLLRGSRRIYVASVDCDNIWFKLKTGDIPVFYMIGGFLVGKNVRLRNLKHNYAHVSVKTVVWAKHKKGSTLPKKGTVTPKTYGLHLRDLLMRDTDFCMLILWIQFIWLNRAKSNLTLDDLQLIIDHNTAWWYINIIKVTVSSWSQQIFNGAWNRCPSLRRTRGLKFIGSFYAAPTVIWPYAVHYFQSPS